MNLRKALTRLCLLLLLASAPSVFCRTIDAALWLDDDEIVLFTDEEYRTIRSDGTEASPWAKITEAFDFPFPQVDAALHYPNGKVYFFYLNQYARYDLDFRRTDPGYPKQISAGWPGISFPRIDAAINYGNGKIFFFYEDQYIRFDNRRDAADSGYPQPINPQNWPGIPWDSLDAAFSRKGETLFFHGEEYLRFNNLQDRAAEGGPRQTDALWTAPTELNDREESSEAQTAAATGPGNSGNRTASTVPDHQAAAQQDIDFIEYIRQNDPYFLTDHSLNVGAYTNQIGDYTTLGKEIIVGAALAYLPVGQRFLLDFVPVGTPYDEITKNARIGERREGVHNETFPYTPEAPGFYEVRVFLTDEEDRRSLADIERIAVLSPETPHLEAEYVSDIRRRMPHPWYTDTLTVNGTTYTGFTRDLSGWPVVMDSEIDDYLTLEEPRSEHFEADGYFLIKGYNHRDFDDPHNLLSFIVENYNAGGYFAQNHLLFEPGEFEIPIFLNDGPGEYDVTVFASSLENFSSSNDIELARFTVINTASNTFDNQNNLHGSSTCPTWDRQIQAIAGALTEGLSSDAEKARAVYHYLVWTLQYDEQHLETDAIRFGGALQVLARTKGICSGQTNLTAALMRAAGLPCRVVDGKLPDGMGHAWNEVYYSGEWHWMDVTWSLFDFEMEDMGRTVSFYRDGY